MRKTVKELLVALSQLEEEELEQFRTPRKDAELQDSKLSILLELRSRGWNPNSRRQ